MHNVYTHRSLSPSLLSLLLSDHLVSVYLYFIINYNIIARTHTATTCDSICERIGLSIIVLYYYTLCIHYTYA